MYISIKVPISKKQADHDACLETVTHICDKVAKTSRMSIIKWIWSNTI